MKRYASVAAGIVLQICLGGIYAFSTYVPSLSGDWGFSSVQTQSVFGLTIFAFTLYMIFFGKKLRKTGPRRLIILSGFLFMAGHVTASFSAGNFPVFLASYLLLISPSMASGYVCPVASGVLWFPKHRGLVTGLTVAGYGAGGVVLSGVVEFLFSRGWPLQTVLQFVGVAWGAVIILCGLLSSTPPGLLSRPEDEGHAPIRAHIKDFSGITLFLFFGTLPGLMLIGALKPFGLHHGLTAAAAVTGVAALSIGNGAGRITWGIIADHAAPRKTALMNMAGIFLSVILLYAAGRETALFIPAGFFLGFFYGGPLVIGPDQTARTFGPENLSHVYPSATAFHGAAAAVGAPLAGLLYTVSNSYTPVLLIAGAGTIAGAFGYYGFVRKSAKLDSRGSWEMQPE